VVEGLASLVDKSLLRLEDGTDAEPRVAMLETIREYALERLAAHGETEGLRRRHAAYYLALAEQAEPALTGAQQAGWLERLEREHDNLRAALRWAQESGDRRLGLRLAGALWRFWYMRGHLSEGRERLTELLAQTESGRDEAESAIVWAKALHGASVLAFRQGDFGQAAALADDSLALHRKAGDIAGMAAALSCLGLVARGQGDYVRASALYEESLALRRGLADTWGIANMLTNLGIMARTQGDDARAAELCEESLGLCRDLRDTWGIALALTSLGNATYEQGYAERAMALYQESLALSRAIGDEVSIAACLEGLAAVAATRGQPEKAAQLCGAATALRDRIGAPLLPDDRAVNERTLAAARVALGDGFLPAWTAGQALPLQQIIAEAL
jgi:tetratricopeptide (TPR) repeat protein